MSNLRFMRVSESEKEASQQRHKCFQFSENYFLWVCGCMYHGHYCELRKL